MLLMFRRIQPASRINDIVTNTIYSIGLVLFIKISLRFAVCNYKPAMSVAFASSGSK